MKIHIVYKRFLQLKLTKNFVLMLFFFFVFVSGCFFFLFLLPEKLSKVSNMCKNNTILNSSKFTFSQNLNYFQKSIKYSQNTIMEKHFMGIPLSLTFILKQIKLYNKKTSSKNLYICTDICFLLDQMLIKPPLKNAKDLAFKKKSEWNLPKNYMYMN